MPILDSKLYGLALHTCSPELGLAISNFIGDNRCQTWDLGRDLSSHLHQYLKDFIIPQNWSDLAFIAVAKGPGSFTSTRIGIVTARTLAQQLDLPLFGISTLAALTWLVKEDGENTVDNSGLSKSAIALQMPAGRGQLFTGIYQTGTTGSNLIELLPDTVMTPEQWKNTLDTLEMPYQLIDAPTNLGNCVRGILELADLEWQQGKRSHWSEVLPFYGHQAVEN